jgi:hypothetical protein
MLWSWKELGLFKDNISEDQQNITKIIEDIRQEIQNDDFEVKITSWRSKMAMKDMVATKADDESNSDPMSNLNDL